VKPPGLRLKLTLAYSAILTVLLALSCVAAYYLFQSQLEAEITDELADRVEALRGYTHFKNDVPTLIFKENDPEVALFVRTAARYHQIYSLTTGELVSQSTEMQLLGLGLVPNEVRMASQESGPVDIETDDGRLRFLNDRVVSPSGQEYLVQVGISMEPVHFALRRFVRISLILVPFGLVLAATAGWLLTGSALRPVRRIIHAAHEIEVSNLAQRLPLTGSGDELDNLATTFNEVFARLEKAFGELRQLTGSIAHELRTPIAALRGEAEIAMLHAQSVGELKDVLASQLEEFDKLARMIDQLLTLARSEAGEVRFERKPFDIANAIGEVVDTFSLLASARRILLDSEPGKDLIATVDPQWLERVLVNVLDNAIKYTPPGGHVSIRGTLEPDAVRVEVQDSGPGISAEALPHIFERFYRADPSRNKEVEGVGLGLSFAKWIVEQHGGTIQAVSEVNRGTCFTIRFPRSR